MDWDREVSLSLTDYFERNAGILKIVHLFAFISFTKIWLDRNPHFIPQKEDKIYYIYFFFHG